MQWHCYDQTAKQYYAIIRRKQTYSTAVLLYGATYLELYGCIASHITLM